MAKVTLRNSIVKDSLADLVKKINSALGRIPDEGVIALDIPEHCEFPGIKPDAQRPCFGPPPRDDRDEVGVLLAVLEAMREKGKTGSPATRKVSRRK